MHLTFYNTNCPCQHRGKHLDNIIYLPGQLTGRHAISFRFWEGGGCNGYIQ
nr:MAG TPA: hypothetical protein [Caudoviricetes sp.]